VQSNAIANSVMKTNIGHDKVALINNMSNSLINQFSAIPKENASSDDVSTKMHCKPMVDFGKNS
jgi:VIT1/CCC1 family predicted Fe2+/Mn2+ transporter